MNRESCLASIFPIQAQQLLSVWSSGFPNGCGQEFGDFKCLLGSGWPL